MMNFKSNTVDTITVAYAKFSKSPPYSERTKFSNWLKERTNSKVLRLLVL